MFSWICPKCGKEVPPSASECPYCATDPKAAASAQQTLPTIPIPPQGQGAPPPGYYPPQPPYPPQGYPPQQYPPQQPPYPQQGQYPPQYPPQQYPPQYQQPYPQQGYPPQQYPPQQYPPQAQAPPVPQQAPPPAPAPAPAAPAPPPPSFGAAPAAPAAPEPPTTYLIDDSPKRTFPAWLAVVLAFAVVALIVYGVRSMSSSGRGDASKTAKTAAKNAKGNPYMKDLEISGFRFSEVNKKLKVTFVAINHGNYDMADIKGEIVLKAKGASPDDPPAAAFQFSISSVPASSVKEIEISEFTTKRKFIDMPDWQFIEPSIELTSPAAP